MFCSAPLLDRHRRKSNIRRIMWKSAATTSPFLSCGFIEVATQYDQSQLISLVSFFYEQPVEHYKDHSHKMCSILCVMGGQCFSYVQKRHQNYFLEFGAALNQISHSRHHLQKKISHNWRLFFRILSYA